MSRRSLKLIFASVLLGMLGVTVSASLAQPLWHWGGLHGPNAAWTWATLADAYAGFLTFFVLICLREPRLAHRLGWLVALLTLGNIASATYMLVALAALPAGAPLTDLWRRRSP